MADDVRASAGTADGAIFAAKEVSANKYLPRVLPQWGSTPADVAVTNPLPAQNTPESSQMAAAGVLVTPKFASISAASSGDNSIVAAVSGKKIRVLSYVIVADAAVAAKFRNATTDITGAMSLEAKGGVAAPYCQVGHFETSATAALNLNLGAAVGVRGHLTYIEV